MIKIFNFPVFYQNMTPRMAIQPGTQPGQCFAFKGDHGTLAIKLIREVEVQNVTIEHIPKVSIFTLHNLKRHGE